MSNNNRPPTNTNHTSENISLFRTITGSSEQTASSFLSRSNTITEALNAFFISEEQTSRPSTPVIRNPSATASTVRANSAVMPNTAVSRTNSMTSSSQAVRNTSSTTQNNAQQAVRASNGAGNATNAAGATNPQLARSVTSVQSASAAGNQLDRSANIERLMAENRALIESFSASRSVSPVIRKKQVKKKKDKSPLKPKTPEEEKTPPTSPETSPDRKGKRTYSDMIAKYTKEEANDEAKKKKWPKYLGSLKVEGACVPHLRKKVQVGDVLTFEPGEIDFRMNFVGKKSVKHFTIRGTSLFTMAYLDRTMIGYVKCEFEEMFVFLLAMRYIVMDGTVLSKPSKKNSRVKDQKRFDMRLDIFLTEEVILNPLNIMTQPGRKTNDMKKFGKTEAEPEKKKEEKKEEKEDDNGFMAYVDSSPKKEKGKKKQQKKDDDELSEEEQKMHHICRLTKESFNKLFNILQIKVTIPTVVQVKSKNDPFNAVRKDKYGGYCDWNDRTNYHIHCFEPKAELLTDQYPSYYKRKSLPQAEPQRKSLDLADLAGQNQPQSPAIAAAGVQQQNPQEKPAGEEGSIMQIEMKKETPKKTIEEDLDELEERILKRYGTTENFDAPANKTLNTQGSQSTQKNRTVSRRNTISSEKKDSSEEEDNEDEDEDEVYNSDEEDDNELREEHKEVRRSSSVNQQAQPQRQEFFNPFSGIANQSSSQVANSQAEGQSGVKSHLNDLFNLQNQNSNHFSLSEPPTTFKSELHVYQKQALTWMKYREGCLDNQRLYDKLNEEIRLLNDLFEELVLIDGSKIYFNPFNGETAVDFPKSRPCKGGLLADEMGLGKTVMTIALIHSHRRPEKPPVSVTEDDGLDSLDKKDTLKKKVRKSFGPLKLDGHDDNDNKAGTLIIVPVTVLPQWEAEMKNHSNEDTMKVMQYYGQSRNKSGKTRLQDYDVVVTSYGIVGSDYASQKEGKKKTGLFAYNWFRVILDEGHFIKGRGTRNAKACCSLDADYRWCLTGTPLQNKLDDLFSIIKFLRVETWGEYFLWNTYINKDTSNEESFELLRSILRPLILRRTKKSTYLDGRTILELPPKEVRTQMIQLTSEERQIYNNLFNGGKNQFDNIVSGGTLQYEYAHVFELLMRLRQVCDHPSLVFSEKDLKDGATLQDAIFKFLDKRNNSSLLNPKNKPGSGGNQNNLNGFIVAEEEKNGGNQGGATSSNRKKVGTNGISEEFVQDTIKRLEKKELGPCTVCLDEILDPIITNCCHVFCRTCILGIVEKLKNCPICRKNLDMNDIMPITMEDKQAYSELLDVKGEKFKKSSKLNALFDYIHTVKAKNEKCVVFSQFLGMLSLIERGLKEEGIKYRRLDGSCTLKQRSQYIDEFKTIPDVTVFMVSLKAGAIGLNLTAANHCVLVDPWWNPAVEDQAIERVHRIGQKNNVTVVRLICEKTIEERMIDLHAKKKGLVNMTLHFNPEEQKKQNMENMIYIMRNYDQ